MKTVPAVLASFFLVNAPVSDLQAAGAATWYSEKDPSINKYTASGEVFDDSKLTCAAWDYPFGTRVKVTNLKNNKSVVCRVNDRGPHKKLGRKIDLTKAAFKRIADLKTGVIRVSVSQVKRGTGLG